MMPYAEVIGHPISHSKSPLIHKFWLDKLGLAGAYRATPVHPAELESYFAERRQDPNWRGCNITLPHKILAMAHIDSASPLSRLIGATNTVARNSDGTLEGGNTDATGFAEPLGNRQFPSVTVIGAGGAARAVLAGLMTRRIGQINILNRDVAKAAALLAEFGFHGHALPLDGQTSPASLLINASSLGMIGQPELPDMMHMVAEDGTVYDLVYAPLETPLLAAARTRGLEVIDGLHMLVGQAAEAFSVFFGANAPREHDAELRALLTA
jgi:shikimate dehydrogenase